MNELDDIKHTKSLLYVFWEREKIIKILTFIVSSFFNNGSNFNKNFQLIGILKVWILTVEN